MGVPIAITIGFNNDLIKECKVWPGEFHEHFPLIINKVLIKKCKGIVLKGFGSNSHWFVIRI